MTKADNFDEIDPRKMGGAKLKSLGFQPMPMMKAIRLKCLDCAGTSQEVLGCTSSTCPLWPYRTGRNPFNKRKGNPKAAEHLKKYHAKAKKAENKRVRVRI